MTGHLACVILAAGRSTRFKSSKTKLLHELAGRPLVEWALETLLELKPAQIIIVYGEHSAQLPERYSEGYRGHQIDFVLQDPPQGTADALAKVEGIIREEIENIVVLPGDAPLMTTEHLSQLAKIKAQLRCDHVVITAEVDDPHGYGRIVRDPDSPEMVAMIVEEADASAEKKLLKEINSSMYLFSAEVFEHLRLASELIGRSAVKGEYYLTDVARVASMGAYMLDDASLIEGLNDRLQLARMDKLVQRRLREQWMREGVSFILPETSYLHADVDLGSDVEVGPQSYLAHGTRIGAGTRLIQGCHLDASTVGEACQLLHVHAHEVTIGNKVRVGPYANLRPGTVLEDNVRIGNFVETKKAHVGAGSKLPHLTYVGDATIGQNCNIGAGTIFCNYDGVNKHHTWLGDGVFIGSNSSLQAPVIIGDGAFVAMASAVTRDVPPGALAVGRARQENKPGYVERMRKRREGLEEAEEAAPAVDAERDHIEPETAAVSSALPPGAAPLLESAPADVVDTPADQAEPSEQIADLPEGSREESREEAHEEPQDEPAGHVFMSSSAMPEMPDELRVPDEAQVADELRRTPRYQRLSREQITDYSPGEIAAELTPASEVAQDMTDMLEGGNPGIGAGPSEDAGFSGSFHNPGYVPDGLVVHIDLDGADAAGTDGADKSESDDPVDGEEQR